MTMPAPIDAAQVMARLQQLRADDLPTDTGRVMAYVYASGVDGLGVVAARAARAVQDLNGLDPTTFPSAAALEREVVGWVRGLLGGGEQVAGTATSGGTESIILAVKAARDAWSAAHPDDDRRPALVAGQTVHPAFAKAAHLLHVDLLVSPVDPGTMTWSGEAARTALAEVGDRACLAVASAPSYPHGVVDDVTGIAAAAAAAGVRCHVDACIGGLVLPYIARSGRPVPPFDFAVEGVTSLSVDLHKYGYAPKGASLVLHRDTALRTPQYWAFTDWPGYPVVNSAITSSKPLGPLASAWAVLQVLGDDGLAALTEQVVEAAELVIRGVEGGPGVEGAADEPGIPGLRVLGDPVGPLVALGADPAAPAPVDPFLLADELARTGWIAQAQPAHGELPRSLHLTLMPAAAPATDQLVAALRDAAAAVAGRPGPAPDPQLIEAAAGLDPAAIDQATARGLLAFAGLGGGDGAGGLPQEMAPVNALIEALPPALAERLLVEFWGLLFGP